LAREEAAASGDPENYQTKPNTPMTPEEIAHQQVMIDAADRILKLSASLEPKRREPGK
jgi:hypothetical protein